LKKYSILHCHSDASLLDGLSKVKDIVKRASELGIETCSLTDHGSLGNIVSFYKECKKNNIKPALGVELYLSKDNGGIKSAENRGLEHLVMVARNKNGWNNLLRLTALSNTSDNFYYKPRLSLEQVAPFSEDMIAMSGHPGSSMCNVLFTDTKAIYGAGSVEEAASFLRPDWEDVATSLAKQHLDIFGKNFFFQNQSFDSERLPVCHVIADCLRIIGKKLGILVFSDIDAHYSWQSQAFLQRIILVSALRTTLKEVNVKLRNGDDESVPLAGFFKSNEYYIKSPEELSLLHPEEELENSNYIASLIENYNILNKPIFPKFACPEGYDSKDYFLHLCREGWNKRIKGRVEDSRIEEYTQRIKYELDVLNGANLNDYFLVVNKIIMDEKKAGYYTGISRGSAGGCLASYLLEIIGIDPIKYNLSFERFYNSSRNTKDRVALPDVDCDFHTNRREHVINSIKNDYGTDRVAHIATFGRLQGRGAATEVFRAHGIPFDESKKITEFIPDEAKISDKLEEMREENDGEASILQWALENNSKDLAEWCTIADDGSLSGPLAPLFSQAIALEGTKKSMGKHASGIVICAEPIANISPMVYDKGSDSLMIGVDLKQAEDLGLVKVDILGTAVLDKLHYISSLAAGIEEEED